MRQRNETKQAQWREWIAQWQASGKTAEVFAREHGVSTSTVYWWRNQLQRQLPAVRPTQTQHTPTVTFVQIPLKAVRASAASREAIEVVLRGDRLVRVPDQFSATALQAVVRALEAIG